MPMELLRNSRFFAFLESLDEINDMSRKFNEFYLIRYDFNREYSTFIILLTNYLVAKNMKIIFQKNVD